MIQILVTIENGADESLLRRMIENMKGVLHTRLARQQAETGQKAKSPDDWFERLEDARKAFDPIYIDMTDERTKYILSK